MGRAGLYILYPLGTSDARLKLIPDAGAWS
jgi:hypothetical protein